MATNRLVVLAAVPLFLILAVTVYLTAQFAVNERAAQGWVRHTYQVIQQLNAIMRDAQDAETGQRGFLLTHKKEFLEPYSAGRRRIHDDLTQFRELTRDNASEQVRAGRLEGLVRDRFSAFELSLAQDHAGPGDMIAVLTAGKQRMDALRREVSTGVSEEEKLLAERDRARRNTENLEIAFAVGAAVLTLGVLLLAAALLVRNNIGLASAERARANEAAILRATLETVRDGVAYFTSEGLLCAFNLNFFRLLDLPERLAVLQKTTLAELEAVEAERPVRVLSPPAEGETALETRHVAYGERELDLYKAPVSTGGFLIGVQDVTARMRAEGMVRQSQKMEAIGHLTGGVAHDFNNLLQIISANLDLAVAGEGVKADPRLRERLQNAVSAVARGSRLTGQLLAFARRQALEPRSIDLGRVIRDMSDMLRRTLGEQIEVETVIGGGLWNTLIDPSQVENTILNLAINARDAMMGNGKLTLEVANAYLDDHYASQHNEVSPGQYVMLAVSDTGTGMTPEVMARVFEPFFTTKPEGKGTGLGLAQAYGFVKQSGGHIKIYSEIGHGTSIKLYLPRTRREQDMLEDVGAQAAQGGSERILVVEDDEGVRAAVVDMLSDLGYKVLRAEDAESALALLGRGEIVDLLFTDVVMPGNIPTREFTRRAQEMIPGLLVLYTSGYTQNAIVHNGKLDDDAFLLSKPYRKDDLARKLRSVFAGTARGPLRPPETIADRKGPAHRGKVLVVEDVALIRMTTVDMIEQIGFPAIEAGDGAEALSVLQNDADITILLTDLGLPGMNGRQLVEEALRLKPDLKVIIASGYSTEEQESGPRPGVSYLTKPFDLAQLRRVLES